MKYGLIAERIGHSFSAEIHSRLFGYEYELKAIAKEELDSFMKTRDFIGINVTIPYKEAVIPYLDYVDQTALQIGAVNTIIKHDNKLCGYNTDVDGLTQLIKRNGIGLEGKKVLILGSGGTSKTALYVSNSLNCREVYRVSRSKNDNTITYDEAVDKHSDADVIINTTPCGMYPNIGESAINIDAFDNLSAAIDVVYNPLRSKLICDARNKGIKAVGGLYMLVAQAACAGEKFVNNTVDSKDIESVYRNIFASKQNIVLIGMPTSGKTSTGKIVAEQLGKEFIDTDEEIYKKTGKHPSEIINESGESTFREIESTVIYDVAKLQNKVIATGGGAVLNPRNVDLLRENGRIYFLDRKLEDLQTKSDRPLSSNREELEKRYNERYNIYISSCDCHIKCVDGKQLNANMILEDIKNENSCN